MPGSVVDVPVSFPPLTGADIRITVDSVRIENTPNYYSQTPIAMPLGIAEVGIPGLHAAPVPATIPSSCQDDLLSSTATRCGCRSPGRPPPPWPAKR